MSKMFFKIGFGLLAAAGLVSPAGAALPTTKTLHGHVPGVVSHLQAKGQLAGTNQIYLAIGLPVRNAAGLTNLFEQINNPASTNFHRFLTSAQFAEQFGPSEADYQAVVDFAHAHGLEVIGTHSNRMVLDVQGSSANVEKAFNVKLKTYHHPTENRDFYASDVDPSVPSSLAVQDISGLENYRRPFTHFKSKATPVQISQAKGAVTQKVTSSAATGSGPFGNYIGDDFRNAYIPGAPSLNGSGQSVGLVQFDGYYASDIAAYESLAGRTNIPLENVLIDGFSGQPLTGGQIEVSLDIEMVVAMAPALAKIIVYEGSPFNFHPNDVLNRIATDNSARQISCSWGWGGGPSTTTDQIFKQMAVQGQSFYDAVGDSDAFTAGANSVNGIDNPLTGNEPSDSPYITQVGGTTLTMNGSGASYASEIVWNWGLLDPVNFDGVGSSGGISTFYPIPSWQTNVNMTACQGSTNFHNTPDIAMTADDVLVVAFGGFYFPGTGGTSCAAPLWAAFTALANQQAASNGQSPVGFINPALYSIANTPNYTNCFHDTTVGNNTWSQSTNLFNAAPGYDLCTGLGTPKGISLVNAVLTFSATNIITQITAPPPPYGSTLATMIGGNPNGTWTLFVQDDSPQDVGVISNGWYVTLTMGNPVGQSANLSLTATAPTSTVPLGSNVVYVIGITNYGPSTASNVVVSDTLPSGVTLVSSNLTLGSLFRDGVNLTWTVGTLVTNSGAQLTLTVLPNGAGNYVNTTTVNASTDDANTDDNYVATSVTVGTVPAPQLSGSYAGSNHQFQFSISDPSLQAYVVQASTNLVTWVPIYTNPTPVTTVTSFLDSSATNYPYRFYRVLLQ